KSQIGEEQVKLSWDRSTDADGDAVQYQVYFGEGKLTLVSTQSGTQYTPTGIDRGKEYTWKVVAIDSLGAKSESPVYTFKTKPNSSPTVPKLTFPTDKSQIGEEQVKLSWDRSTDADGDAVQYQVYFGEGKLTLLSTQSGTQYTPTGIDRGKEYTWKVVAIDSLGAKSESPVYTFKTILNRPPEKPNLTAPYNKTTVDYKTVTLIWNCNDPDKDTLEYELQYWKKGSIAKKSTTTTTQYTIRNLQPASTYEWKVIATDTYGAKTESNIQAFNTVENRSPSRPGIISPSNEEKNVDPKEVKLRWNCSDPDGDPLKYDVYFGTSRDKLNLIKSNITANEADPGTLKEETTYYWKVTANDGNDNTVESEIWEFKTKPKVDPVLLIALGVGAVGIIIFAIWYLGI
ncbi:fibronectin type III domain-containing protein, partial [Mesotoga sp. UBA6090]